MLKKICAICLCLCLCMTSCCCLAGSYSSALDSIWSSYKSGNSSASSAVQQAVNGSYRTVELLYIICQLGS